MNEELQEELLKIIKDGRGLVTEQSPEVISDIIRCAQITPIFFFVVSVMFFVTSCYFFRKGRTIVKEDGERHKKDEEEKWYFLAFILTAVGGVAVLAFLVTLFRAYQATFTPYAYLLHYANDLFSS